MKTTLLLLVLLTACSADVSFDRYDYLQESPENAEVAVELVLHEMLGDFQFVPYASEGSIKWFDLPCLEVPEQRCLRGEYLFGLDELHIANLSPSGQVQSISDTSLAHGS